MITVDYCRLMARYNAWQNNSLITAADTLSDAQRWQDRGAFFGSIAATFNHLYWDDALWLARFTGDERPEDHHPVALAQPAEWSRFRALRRERDDAVTDYMNTQQETDLSASVVWYPGGGDNRMERPKALCLVHLFNHQTHHRGQIHGMLTAAGATPEPTDLPMLATPPT